MKKAIQICLRAGETIYINGAVLRVDRKVSMELLNDVTFLLESHVILAEEARTPLRQLYFIIQTMLIEPTNAVATRAMFEETHALLLESFENEQVLAGLKNVHDLIKGNRAFDALKAVRALFPIEDKILTQQEFAPAGVGKQERKVTSWK